MQDLRLRKGLRVHEIEERIEKAVVLAENCGTTDGAHHKMWVIDQMLRVLIPDEYEEQFGSDQNWDQGTPP